MRRLQKRIICQEVSLHEVELGYEIRSREKIDQPAARVRIRRSTEVIDSRLRDIDKFVKID